MKGKQYSWKKEYFLTQVLKSYKFWVVNLQTILSCKSSYKKISVKRTELVDAQQSGITNEAAFWSFEKFSGIISKEINNNSLLNISC